MIEVILISSHDTNAVSLHLRTLPYSKQVLHILQLHITSHAPAPAPQDEFGTHDAAGVIGDVHQPLLHACIDLVQLVVHPLNDGERRPE